MAELGEGGVFGFTYRGFHCTEQGIQFAPNEETRGNRMEEFTVHNATVDGRDGGYYFSNQVNPRVFRLPCYMESATLGEWERMMDWLDRRYSGVLEFDERPGMLYDVRPTERLDQRVYYHWALCESSDRGLRRSGTLIVSLTAHSPWARRTQMAVTTADELAQNGHYLEDNTGMILSSQMPPLDYSGQAIGASKTILLYNPGNERAYLDIDIAVNVGTAGLTVYNKQTNQYCMIQGITTANTTALNQTYHIDSGHGRCVMKQNGVETLTFAYHDLGYIQQEGCQPVTRGLQISYTSGSRNFTSNGLRPWMAKQYMYLLGQWRKIDSVSGTTGSLEAGATFPSTGSASVMVANMNEIVLTGSAGLNLPKLTFSYVPRYR